VEDAGGVAASALGMPPATAANGDGSSSASSPPSIITYGSVVQLVDTISNTALPPLVRVFFSFFTMIFIFFHNF
jgi:hypothetical protein